MVDATACVSELSTADPSLHMPLQLETLGVCLPHIPPFPIPSSYRSMTTETVRGYPSLVTHLFRFADL